MANITLRQVKGSPLSNTEIDNNFSNLNADKLEINGNGSQLTNITFTQVTGTVPVNKGGTGATTLTSNNVLIGNGTNAVTFKANPSGAFVGTTDTQTLSNKTIAFGNNTLTDVASVNTSQTLTNKTINGSNNTISNISLTTAVTGTLQVTNGGTGATSLSGVLIGNGTSAFSTKANPSGAFVGTTDTQTLTNKTITFANNTLTGVVSLDTVQTLTNKTITFANNTLTGVVSLDTVQTISNKTFNNYTETVYSIPDGTTVNLNPNNGPIQTWVLGANRTPGQTNWASGQGITLLIDDGASRTINWSTLNVEWKTDSSLPPALNEIGFTVIILWKVGSVIYGARVGDS